MFLLKNLRKNIELSNKNKFNIEWNEYGYY